MRNTLLFIAFFILEVHNLEIQDSDAICRGQYYVSKSFKVTKDMIGKMKTEETEIKCRPGDLIMI